MDNDTLASVERQRDAETRGHGDAGNTDTGTRGHGDAGNTDAETRGHGVAGNTDTGTPGHGDAGNLSPSPPITPSPSPDLPIPASPHLRVLLADDHRLVIEGISNLLALNGIDVVGIAFDGLEAVSLARQLHPDLILMDIRMPNCDGLSATRLIKSELPEIKIVMLTTSTESQDLFEAVKSGACGYLLKTMTREDFLDALHNAEQGIPPFSPGLAARLLDEFARLSREDDTGMRGHGDTGNPSPSLPFSVSPCPGLTERQGEVLQLVALGLTYKEVGERLSLSEHTVRFHMVKIMERLHLYNRTQVLIYAGKMGIKPPD